MLCHRPFAHGADRACRGGGKPAPGQPGRALRALGWARGAPAQRTGTGLQAAVPGGPAVSLPRASGGRNPCHAVAGAVRRRHGRALSGTGATAGNRAPESRRLPGSGGGQCGGTGGISLWRRRHRPLRLLPWGREAPGGGRPHAAAGWPCRKRVAGLLFRRGLRGARRTHRTQAIQGDSAILHPGRGGAGQAVRGLCLHGV